MKWPLIGSRLEVCGIQSSTLSQEVLFITIYALCVRVPQASFPACGRHLFVSQSPLSASSRWVRRVKSVQREGHMAIGSLIRGCDWTHSELGRHLNIGGS